MIIPFSNINPNKKKIEKPNRVDASISVENFMDASSDLVVLCSVVYIRWVWVWIKFEFTYNIQYVTQVGF